MFLPWGLFSCGLLVACTSLPPEKEDPGLIQPNKIFSRVVGGKGKRMRLVKEEMMRNFFFFFLVLCDNPYRADTKKNNYLIIIFYFFIFFKDHPQSSKVGGVKVLLSVWL